MNETHHLMETRKSLERSLAETEGPMRVTSECIYHREGRKGIDLVNDAPENSLMREVDTIKSCQDKMRQTLEQVGFDSHYVIGQYLSSLALVKFIYSEKTTNFCEISTVDLSYVVTVKSMYSGDFAKFCGHLTI